MRRIIRTSIIILFSFLVWNKWGGVSNEMGTFIILMVDAFLLNTIVDDIILIKEAKNTKEYDEKTSD